MASGRATGLTDDLVPKPALNIKVLKIYAFGQLFLIVLLMLNVLFNWSNYCYWRLGLILGNCYLSKAEGPHFQHEYTLEDIHSDVCDSQTTESVMDAICPDFCSNLSYAKTAGIVCFVLNILALITNAVLSYLHFMAAHRQRLFRRSVIVLLFVPFVLCLVQVIVYPFAANLTGADSVHTSKAIPHITKPVNLGLAGGYVVAVIIMLSQLASAISSLYPHRKLYLQPYSPLPGVELTE